MYIFSRCNFLDITFSRRRHRGVHNFTKNRQRRRRSTRQTACSMRRDGFIDLPTSVWWPRLTFPLSHSLSRSFCCCWPPLLRTKRSRHHSNSQYKYKYIGRSKMFCTCKKLQNKTLPKGSFYLSSLPSMADCRWKWTLYRTDAKKKLRKWNTAQLRHEQQKKRVKWWKQSKKQQTDVIMTRSSCEDCNYVRFLDGNFIYHNLLSRF